MTKFDGKPEEKDPKAVGEQVVGDTAAAGVARAPVGVDTDTGEGTGLENAPVVDSDTGFAVGTPEADQAQREKGGPNSQANEEILKRDKQLAEQATNPMDRDEAREAIRAGVAPDATADDRARAEEAKAMTPGLSFATPGPTGAGETVYGVCPRHGLPLIELNNASTNFQTIVVCPQLDYRANNDQAKSTNPPIIGVL